MDAAPDIISDLPPGGFLVEASVPGNVWSVGVQPGDDVLANQSLIILESMKMEIEVKASQAGRVHEVHCAPGKMVQAGQALVTLIANEVVS